MIILTNVSLALDCSSLEVNIQKESLQSRKDQQGQTFEKLVISSRQPTG